MLKLRFLLFFAISCLLLAACGGTDSSLVNNMEQAIRDADDQYPDLSETVGTLEKLKMVLANVDPALKTSPEFADTLANLNRSIEKLPAEIDLWKAKYEEKRDLLTNLIDNYKDGKIKTAEVKQEFQTLQGEMNDILKQLNLVNASFDKISADYAKMKSAWNASLEEE